MKKDGPSGKLIKNKTEKGKSDIFYHSRYDFLVLHQSKDIELNSHIVKLLHIQGKRMVFLVLLLLLLVVSFYAYHRHTIYNSIQIIAKDGMALEYGSVHYHVEDFIQKVEGKVVSIKNDIDTNVVGEQEVIVEVQKEDIVRDVPLVISVIDTIAPVIQVKEEKVTITQGNDYSLLNNIQSVKDEVDGDIPYMAEVSENSVFYYQFDFDASTIENIGDHTITVLAKDKNGNSSFTTFILQVVAPKKVYYQPVYVRNAASNSHSGDLVSIAYSYLGYPYISGANGPYGFDCSGFVQHVYRQVGISVSRSTSTQIHDGVGVRYEDIQPGDIICWGYSNGAVTHSTLYVGNGKMIHAANTRMGVIESDVSYWLARSGTQILSIRRIQG